MQSPSWRPELTAALSNRALQIQACILFPCADPSARALSARTSYDGSVSILSASDPLPGLPRRVLVAGTSGSGKTTLAAHIGKRLGIRQVEIDALFHGHGWTPRATFEADVEALSATPSWVTERQYDVVRERLAERADLLVWLDFDRITVMRQVVQRTIRRRLRREVLWNGNLEPPRWTVLSNHDHIVRWAWSTHHKTAQRILVVQEQHPELVIVRLRDRRSVEQWSSRLEPLANPGANPS